MGKRNIALNFTIIIYLILNIGYSKAQTIDLTGSLVDSISKTKLFYGTLFVKNQKDSLIKGILANENGEFLFKDIIYSKGMYLTTSYLGYKEKKVYFTLNNKTKVNIGEVLLVPENTNLNEFVIEGVINPVEKKFDRKIYKMDSEKISIARTVLDLLRILPGVVIDNEGNVRYKGAEATIYVDDQPLNFQFPNIEMIPVDKVENIELIDAAMLTGGDGRSGIINIKFKQASTNGVSGMMSANTSTICFESANKSKAFLNINYKNKKYTFFLNTSFENAFSYAKTYTEKEIDFSQTLYNQTINSSGNYQRQTNFNNIGLVYWPKAITKIYLSCGFYTLGYKSNFETNFLENKIISQQVMNRYLNSESVKDDQLYEGVNMSYWHKFDTLDTYIKLFGNFNIYNLLTTQNTNYNFSQLNTNIIDSIYNVLDKRYSKSYGVNLNVFFNYSVSKATRWNLSYNFSVGLKDTTANEHYVFSNYYLPNSQFDVNTNQRHDLSWRIGTKLNKLKIDGGVNILDYNINGNYLRYNLDIKDTILSIKKNYFKGFYYHLCG